MAKESNVGIPLIKRALSFLDLKSDNIFKALLKLDITNEDDLYIFMNKPISVQSKEGLRKKVRDYISPHYFRYLLKNRKLESRFFNNYVKETANKLSLLLMVYLGLVKVDSENKIIASKEQLLKIDALKEKFNREMISFIKDKVPELLGDK